MSLENVEIVRRAFDAFGRGDTPALLAMVSFDVVVRQTPPIPDARTYHGREGFQQVIADWTEVFDGVVMRVDELIDGEDKVLTRVHQTARGAGSAAPVDFDTWFVWAVESEVIVRRDMFNDKSEALEAAGLTE
jgi:ketosteroid isomerase-like protein